MKTCLSLLLFSFAAYADPSTNRVYKAFCPDCERTSVIHPKSVVRSGGVSTPEGMVGIYALTFECPMCQQEFAVTKSVKKPLATAEEVQMPPPLPLNKPNNPSLSVSISSPGYAIEMHHAKEMDTSMMTAMLLSGQLATNRQNVWMVIVTPPK